MMNNKQNTNNNLVIQGTITALSPIFHGGNEKTGSSQLLRRQKFFVENDIKEIPILSGNAIRGITRRLLMEDFLCRVNYKITNLSLYHSLFSGGVLEQTKKTGNLDFQLRKTVRTMLPPIDLYGMSFGNQILPGRMKVKEALPICSELNELLDPELQTDNSIYTFLDYNFFTRKDDKNKIDLPDPEEDKDPVQMKVDLETFVPGTRFIHGFVIEQPSDLDTSILAHIINLWQNKPFVGGKSASGYGQIKLKYDLDNKITNGLYLEFLEKNKSLIIQCLDELNKK